MPAEQNQPVPFRRPVAWLYLLIAGLSGLVLALLLGVRIRRDPALRGLKGPLIILGNHPSYLDPAIMAMAFFPRRICYLTSHGFFRSGGTRWLLKKMAAIPKVQFRSDAQALKNIFRVIRGGGILAIYPEGQRSLDGSRQPVDEAIAKLVRKTACPVALVHEDGAYLTWPRWSQSAFRIGRIDVRASLLFTPQELASLATPEIQARIEAALDYQDYSWQLKKKRAFLSLAPARGLHNLCHQCPACGRDLAMQSSRFHLTCQYCGNQVRLDRFGFLKPVNPASDRSWPDPRQWHQWQLQQMELRIRQPDFQLAFAARVELLADDGTVTPAGHGLIQLTADSFGYHGEPDDQPGLPPLQLDFPIRNKTGISADYGLQFELALADRSYQFVLDQGQAVVMIIDAFQAIQQRG